MYRLGVKQNLSPARYHGLTIKYAFVPWKSSSHYALSVRFTGAQCLHGTCLRLRFWPPLRSHLPFSPHVSTFMLDFPSLQPVIFRPTTNNFYQDSGRIDSSNVCSTELEQASVVVCPCDLFHFVIRVRVSHAPTSGHCRGRTTSLRRDAQIFETITGAETSRDFAMICF